MCVLQFRTSLNWKVVGRSCRRLTVALIGERVRKYYFENLPSHAEAADNNPEALG